MSEVLLAIPHSLSPNLCSCEDPSNFSSSSIASCPTGRTGNHFSRSLFERDKYTFFRGVSSLHVLSSLQNEEKCHRLTLLLEYEVEHMQLLTWRRTIDDRCTKTMFQRRMESLVMREVMMQHRMFRFAHLEQRFGTSTTSPTLRDFILDEYFERENIALQEILEFFEQISAFLHVRARIDEISILYTNFLAFLQYEQLEKKFLLPSYSNGEKIPHQEQEQQILKLQHNLRSVRDEAEMLSFTLNHKVEVHRSVKEESAEDVANEDDSSDATSYAIAVIRSAVDNTDELRVRLHKLTKKQREMEQELKSTKRRLMEEKERATHLQQQLNTTEEMAVSVVSQCGLHVSGRDSLEVGYGAAASQMASTDSYMKRVLQELCRSTTTLTKQVQWEAERSKRQLQERDAALELSCDKVRKLVALIQPMHNINGVKEEDICIKNLPRVLEEIITGITELKQACGICIGATCSSGMRHGGHEAASSSISNVLPVALCGASISNATAPTVSLSLDQNMGKSCISSGGDAGNLFPLCVMPLNGTHFDVLTLVLRRLEETRREKFLLQIALEEKQSGRHLFNNYSSGSFGSVVVSADESRCEMSCDSTWIQTAHRLREANTLLQDELRLEREVVESLKVKLLDAERHLRQLQKQCYRLRRSGRFDAYEVVEQLCNGDGSSDSSSEEDDENHGSDTEKSCSDDVERERDTFSMKEESLMVDAPLLLCDVSQCYSQDDERSLCAEKRKQQIACLREQQLVRKSLTHTQGLLVCSFCLSDVEDPASAFLASCLSLHTFFKAVGALSQPVRHLAIIYPLPPPLAQQLPVERLLHRLQSHVQMEQKKERGSTVHIINLRETFRGTGKYLRGCMDMTLSHDGRFIYALTSADTDVLETLCSPQCLSIPSDRRFRFSSIVSRVNPSQHQNNRVKTRNRVALNCSRNKNRIGIHNFRRRHSVNTNTSTTTTVTTTTNKNKNNDKNNNSSDGSSGIRNSSLSGSTRVEVNHTLTMDMLGWCGRGGICAWAMECMRFDSPAEEARFERHLRKEYRLVLRLTAAEALHFVGGCVETMGVNAAGKFTPRLFISTTAFHALTPEHRVQLLRWYGGFEGLSLLRLGSVEQHMTAPLRRLVSLVHWHGRVLSSKTAPRRDTLAQFGILQQSQSS